MKNNKGTETNKNKTETQNVTERTEVTKRGLRSKLNNDFNMAGR